MSGAAPAHLLHLFSTFVPAGPEMRSVRLIHGLGADFCHSIVAIDGRTDARAELEPDAPARVLESPPRAGTAATVRALRALIRRERPDLVLTYNWGAFDGVFASLSLGRGGRHLHHEDGFNVDEAHGFKARREWTRRFTLPRVARVVVPSHLLEGVARERWGLRPERLRLIPNGIDLATFGERDGNPELRRELGIDPAAFVVGFVGHLRPVKNPQRLLRAFATLEGDAALLVLGEGPEAAGLEAEASRLGLRDRLHLVGHRSPTAPWYRLMDAFALSSDSEQMPVALLEAMASSLPVVSTEVGDVARMLPEEQRPFVIPKDEESELGSGLARLHAEPELRARLGRVNRARVEERYTFEGMLAAYRELYETTLGTR